MNCCDAKPICRWSLLLLGAGWFLVALFIGETELLSELPGSAIPLAVAGLSCALLFAFWKALPFRKCVEAFDVRLLILPHLTRFVGIYFLFLHGRGELPPEFALPAAWGDILVAAGALALLTIPAAFQNRAAVLTWNIIGFLDILFVVKTAATIVLGPNRETMSVMTRLPLSFLPTLLVPLIIFTHVILFIRLLERNSRRPEKQDLLESEPMLDQSTH